MRTGERVADEGVGHGGQFGDHLTACQLFKAGFSESHFLRVTPDIVKENHLSRVHSLNGPQRPLATHIIDEYDLSSQEYPQQFGVSLHRGEVGFPRSRLVTDDDDFGVGKRSQSRDDPTQSTIVEESAGLGVKW